jgi:hypothetical protein
LPPTIFVFLVTLSLRASKLICHVMVIIQAPIIQYDVSYYG